MAKDDKTINPDLERMYAERAHSRKVEGARHAVYGSHPKEVAALIEEARSMLYRSCWALLSPVGRIAALQGLKFSWGFCSSRFPISFKGKRFAGASVFQSGGPFCRREGAWRIGQHQWHGAKISVRWPPGC